MAELIWLASLFSALNIVLGDKRVSSAHLKNNVRIPTSKRQVQKSLKKMSPVFTLVLLSTFLSPFHILHLLFTEDKSKR